MKKGNGIITLFVIYILVNMILFPKLYMQRTLDGISAWAFNVLPSVLPFMFFTKILSKTNGIEKISRLFKNPCYILFKTPPLSAYVFFMSIISGYPVGAKLTADLFENGKISKQDAFRMTSFCSTSGPMFIIGAVGIGLLKSALFGYIIFASHILGAIVNGLFYRKLTMKNSFSGQNHKTLNKNNDLSNIIADCAISIISIGVIIAIFFVIITTLSPLLGFLPKQIVSIIEGIIEITKGCIDISSSFRIFFCPS